MPESKSVEPSEYLVHIEDDARALLAAAWTDPMLTVPTCPEWTLSDLVAHIASAFHWIEEIVRTRATDYVPVPQRPDGWEEVSAWFDKGIDALLATLRDADPATEVWNWVVMGPGPAAFWIRRAAHEVSIHRWDAENAVHVPDPIGPALALDGIDEYLTIASKWLEFNPSAELTGRLGLETTEGLAVTAVLHPNSLEQRRGTDGADCVVRGDASSILLWLVRRKSLLDDGIDVAGDVSIAALWAEVKFG